MNGSKSRPADTPLRELSIVLMSRRTWRAYYARIREDRIVMRSSALAYETLLSIVPLTAVAMAAVRALGGPELSARLLRFAASEYIPSAAGPAIERFLPLIEGLDLQAVGAFGLLALIPVMYSLVSAVELALSDIFRAPRRAEWWLLAVLGSVLTLGPLGSVLTVRYVPLSHVALDHVLTPLLLISALLYLVFRHMPNAEVRDRAALSGALSAAFLLTAAKAAFGLYTTHLATSIHLIWGAVAFIPLLLVWVGVSWATLLLGAELSATLQLELNVQQGLESGVSAALRPRSSRLLRRVRRRALDTVSSQRHFVQTEGPNDSSAAPK